jgi:hypothetical protein
MSNRDKPSTSFKLMPKSPENISGGAAAGHALIAVVGG